MYILHVCTYTLVTSPDVNLPLFFWQDWVLLIQNQQVARNAMIPGNDDDDAVIEYLCCARMGDLKCQILAVVFLSSRLGPLIFLSCVQY